MWYIEVAFVCFYAGFFINAALSLGKIQAAEDMFNALEWEVNNNLRLDNIEHEKYNKYKSLFR